MTIKQSFRRLPVTLSLITLSCLVSVITWFGELHTPLSWLYYNHELIISGQIWRLITPIFLHFPAVGIIFAHLAFNMIWLYQFGELIERYDSPRFLLLLVIVSGVISNTAQAQLTNGLFGGMSGVVYALLGYLFVIQKLNPAYPGRIPNNLAYFLIGFMLLAALGVFGQGIANTAHIVGFLVGIAFAVIKGRRRGF
ncbi:MAG: hypothetical protein CR975_02565 [Gammaproteobacteria bacterium]|nr:MAG: hypothetical protein CR975_02565 [Gammaproteobacteria bacterium]